jgi:V/A-type H+-transporting ATPase subunit I
MLRPERMSRVSVTGSKGVMTETIETLHELRLVHLSDYDGAWEGFDNGNPMEGGDEASETEFNAKREIPVIRRCGGLE